LCKVKSHLEWNRPEFTTSRELRFSHFNTEITIRLSHSGSNDFARCGVNALVPYVNQFGKSLAVFIAIGEGLAAMMRQLSDMNYETVTMNSYRTGKQFFKRYGSSFESSIGRYVKGPASVVQSSSVVSSIVPSTFTQRFRFLVGHSCDSQSCVEFSEARRVSQDWRVRDALPIASSLDATPLEILLRSAYDHKVTSFA